MFAAHASRCFPMLPDASQCFPVHPNAGVFFCGCVGSGLVLHCPLKTQRRGYLVIPTCSWTLGFLCTSAKTSDSSSRCLTPHWLLTEAAKQPAFFAHKLSFNLSTLELLHSREHLVSFLSFKNQHSFQFKVHCHLGEGRTGMLTKLEWWKMKSCLF